MIIVIPSHPLFVTDSLKKMLENMVVKTTLRKSNGAIRVIFPLLKTHIKRIFAISNTIVIKHKNPNCIAVIECPFSQTYGIAMRDRIIAVIKKIVVGLLLGDRYFFVNTELRAHRNAARTAKRLLALNSEGFGEIIINAPINDIAEMKIISFDRLSFKDILASRRIKIGVRHEIAMQLTAITPARAYCHARAPQNIITHLMR